MQRSFASPCATLGLLLVAPCVALALWADDAPAPETPGRELPALTEADAELAEQRLRGLWMRYDGRGEGDPIRFWYFHGDGKGLYRYGRVGLANTHSFDYTLLEDDELFLRFRKPGEEHVSTIDIERDGSGRLWLRMAEDPREPGARYHKVESELDFAGTSAELGDRLWIDYRNYATGGAGFHMYQLAPTAMDGRGVGWFHRGDFDEWSTESLTYRIAGDRIELFFDLREEPSSTRFRLDDDESTRVLELEADPRDYGARHRYLDGGRSFGSPAFARVLALEHLLDP